MFDIMIYFMLLISNLEMDSKYDRNIETDYKQQMSNENDVFMLKHRKER